MVGEGELSFLRKVIQYGEKQWKTGEMLCQFEPFPADLNETLGTQELSLKSLAEELEIFNGKVNPKKGSLDRLKKVLKRSQSDLSAMVVQLSETSKGFSEDAKNSALHQMIRKLTELSKSQAQLPKELKIVANECLGVMGPLDLQTKILYPMEIPVGNLTPFFHNPVALSYGIFDHFSQRSVDQGPEKVRGEPE